MSTILTFIIPVRHPENARDWGEVKRKLSQTVKSIAAQDNEKWKAVIVANTGSDLPCDLPPGFSVAHVDFPPNPIFELGQNDVSVFLDAVLLDKGRRVLAGMLHAGATDYLMVVDDDDFISKRITGYVEAHKGSNGWYFREGYIWTDGGKLACPYRDFSTICGTSHIIRKDLFALPACFEDAGPDYIRQMMGSHMFIKDKLAARGFPLEPLPFCGAVYRMGYAGSHSRSRTMMRHVFVNRRIFREPLETLRRLFFLKRINQAFKYEFWGAKAL